MTDNKSKKSQWKTVLHIPSSYLALIKTEDNLLAAYSGLETMIYDFAQEVNQICVDFFKKNSFICDQYEDRLNPKNKNTESMIPMSFWAFNDKVLSYYDLFSAEDYADIPVLIQHEKVLNKNLNIICDKLLKTSSQDNTFVDITACLAQSEWFYKKICLKNASLELQKKYEKVNRYFEQLSFDVFAVFDVIPLYLSGEYQKNYEKFEEQAEELKKYIAQGKKLEKEDATEKQREVLLLQD